MEIVVHHNAACGTSRNVLEIVAAAGYQPTVIEYLTEGWTRPQLLALFAAADLTPRAALREREALAIEPALLRDDAPAEDIIAAMIRHPVLVNRPIVCTPRGVRLCRPAEMVLDLIDRLPPGPLHRKDGSLLIDADGKRVAP